MWLPNRDHLPSDNGYVNSAIEEAIGLTQKGSGEVLGRDVVTSEDAPARALSTTCTAFSRATQTWCSSLVDQVWPKTAELNIEAALLKSEAASDTRLLTDGQEPSGSRD